MTTTEAKQMPDQASAAAAAAAPVHQTGDSDPSKDPSQTQKKEKKEGEKGPSDRRDITPKPKLTKAERREKQEKQREAKRTQQQQKQHDSGGGGTGRTSDQNPQSSSQHDKKVESTAPANGNTKQDPSNQSPVGSTEGVVQTKSTMDSMFAHLPPYKELPDPHAPEFTSTLHPDVIELGMKYATGQIQEDNARCRAMLHCFMRVLCDYYYTEDDTENGRGDKDGKVDYKSHLDHAVLKASFQFWTVHCRPHCVSMGNAFTFVKSAVASLDREMPLEDAKVLLMDSMERYLVERLDVADQAMAEHAMTKLSEGDVVLTYGFSEAVAVLLTKAHQVQGLEDISVWVVDAGPHFAGKQMLQTLQEVGIQCGYVLLHSVSYVLPHVTKVFLGASALFSNGSVYATAGTACVALLATQDHSSNIPVLVCCETYKISNKVQLESITHNELGNPDVLLTGSSGSSNLKKLNILYDVTPSEYVTGIVTELGIIPPTSVAVLLREMNPQDAAYKA